MRIFLGLSDICGYYSNLERGFKALGYDCTFLNAFPANDYARDRPRRHPARVLEWLGARRVASRDQRWLYLGWKALQALAMLPTFVWAALRHDAFVFASGLSFLPPWDLRLLRLLNKRVVVVFHGSDARPPFMNAAVVGHEGPVDVAACVAATARVKRRVRSRERAASVVINHAPTAQFHTRPVVNWLCIGIPIVPASGPAVPGNPAARDPSSVIAVHAPTRPGPKGSAEIAAAVASLRAGGSRLELVELVGRPHADVLEALARCDFAVDELYSDTTLASFGTEAAAFGRPAIVGLECPEEALRHTPAEWVPPAYVCKPAQIVDAIRDLTEDVALRERLGAQARAFVAERWSVEAVAGRYVRVLKDEIPDEWWLDPAEVRYVHGWGLRAERLAEVVEAVVRERGEGALQLDDRPHLLAELSKVRRRTGSG